MLKSIHGNEIPIKYTPSPTNAEIICPEQGSDLLDDRNILIAVAALAAAGSFWGEDLCEFLLPIADCMLRYTGNPRDIAYCDSLVSYAFVFHDSPLI